MKHSAILKEFDAVTKKDRQKVNGLMKTNLTMPEHVSWSLYNVPWVIKRAYNF